MNDLDRFRTEYPSWADLPDGAIESSMAFAWAQLRWAVDQALNDLKKLLKPYVDRLLATAFGSTRRIG